MQVCEAENKNESHWSIGESFKRVSIDASEVEEKRRRQGEEEGVQWHTSEQERLKKEERG